MKKINFIQANKLAWEEVAPFHAKQSLQKLLRDFKQPGFSCLDPIETQWLVEINIKGKAVAHLCCNNGQELLSIKNLGAGYCVGFDISENFIEQARQLAQAGHIDCEFIATDVHRIPSTYDKRFDLIYISIGALGWMPDLEAFFAI